MIWTFHVEAAGRKTKTRLEGRGFLSAHWLARPRGRGYAGVFNERRGSEERDLIFLPLEDAKQKTDHHLPSYRTAVTQSLLIY
ncbi:hypothetical protein MHYP_G00261710 [Metynnis hypsauchen]